MLSVGSSVLFVCVMLHDHHGTEARIMEVYETPQPYRYPLRDADGFEWGALEKEVTEVVSILPTPHHEEAAA